MIVDCHAHVFPDTIAQRAALGLQEAYGAAPVAIPTTTNLLHHMDRAGVDRSLLMPVATKPAQVPAINDWLLSLNDDRLQPFGAIHPHYPHWQDELKRLVAAGIRGVKLQPFFQGFSIDDPVLHSLLEYTGEKLWVMMHAGDEIFPLEDIEPTPARLAWLVERFPSLQLIAAHAGGYQRWDEVEEHLVGRRLLFDLAYTIGFAPEAQVRRIITAHGPERIVWGSDFPWQSPARSLENLRSLQLNPAIEAAILGGNALREFG